MRKTLAAAAAAAAVTFAAAAAAGAPAPDQPELYDPPAVLAAPMWVGEPPPPVQVAPPPGFPAAPQLVVTCRTPVHDLPPMVHEVYLACDHRKTGGWCEEDEVCAVAQILETGDFQPSGCGRQGAGEGAAVS